MAGETEPEWDSLSFIARSTYRTIVVKYLGKHGPTIPSVIAKSGDHDIAKISTALSDLREEGVVELLVSEDIKRGRIYGLTSDGEQLLNQLDRVHSNGGEQA